MCRLFLYVIGGSITVILWIILFVSGLLINSSYYRAALNYDYATLHDWFMTIVTFTLSNVPLLAFLAGILGGICSYVSVSENCSLTKKDLKYLYEKQKEKRNDPNKPTNKQDNDIEKDYSPVLYESPFVSGFRGVIVFLGILALQYISSFAELGAIEGDAAKTSADAGKGTQMGKEITKVKLGPADLDIMSYIKNRENCWMRIDDSDTLVNYLFYFQDRIAMLPADSITYKYDSSTMSEKRKEYEANIKLIRRKIKVPSVAEIPGMSSKSYFKFAIIVSFLAFIFGFNPKRFTDFLSKFNK